VQSILCNSEPGVNANASIVSTAPTTAHAYAWGRLSHPCGASPDPQTIQAGFLSRL